MLEIFMYILESKKELVIGLTLSILYVTYYLVEAVKKPTLICHKGKFRQLLEEEVPLLREYYWPTPWCVESRLQTVLGSVLRSYLLPPVQYQREIFQLSDGGRVALDWLEPAGGGGGGGGGGGAEPVATVLVLPGLTGGAHADYARCLALAARRLGARACVFSYRGLGGVPLATPRLYCALSHADLAEVVRHARARSPGAPVLACGVSLGGLILGHYLAASGARAGLAAALAVSAPLDVERGAACIERPPLNALLSWHMARNLRRTVEAHAPLAARLDAAARRAVQRSRSVRQFDAAFTAAHFGFESAAAYYRAATLRDKLHLVRAPLLCLCAGDDPFQPWEALPAAAARASPAVALAVTARGGHIGFLEGWWPAQPAPRQYIARLAYQYFAAMLRRPDLLHAAPPLADDAPVPPVPAVPAAAPSDAAVPAAAPSDAAPPAAAPSDAAPPAAAALPC